MGTLTETSELHRQAFNEVFAEEGLDWTWDEPTYRRLLDHVGGSNRVEVYAASRPEQEPITHDRAAELHRKKTERYATLVRSSGVQLRPGVKRLISEVRLAGLQIGFATGTSLDNIEASFAGSGNRIGLTDFDAYTIRETIERPKPAPDAHLRCMELLNVEAAQVLAIEDSADGVASASSAGAAVVATPGQYVSGQSFAGADLVLASLGDPEHPTERLDAGAGPVGGVATLGWLATTLGLV
ncbi:MAG: HAD-IA family hydrolase [Actinomycetota bacterium]